MILSNMLNYKTPDYQWNLSGENKFLLNPIMKEQQEATKEDLFIPLGTEFIFTKTSKNIRSIFLSRDPLTHMHQKSTVAMFFNDKPDISHNIFLEQTSPINDLKAIKYPEVIKKNDTSKKR